MAARSSLAFVATLAWRETRGAGRHFAYLVACVTLGVGALVAVGSFASSLERTVGRSARALMGGDVEIRSTQPLSPAAEVVVTQMARGGVEVLPIQELVAMSAAREKSQIVELKTVPPGYPFYGELVTEPAAPLGALVGKGRVLVHPSLLQKLGASVGDRLKIGPTIFKFLSGQDVEAQYHEEIYRMTIIDGLTQVHVKRYLLEALDKELMRARRHARDLSFLMLDIDHFKKINDVHGHLAGDYVLKEVARIIQQRIRRDEVLARYGGEEFAIILPETTLEGAFALADGLREKIEQSRFVFQNETIRVTISIGGALLQESDRTSLDLIKRADEKLYEAKRAGRNRVLV